MTTTANYVSLVGESIAVVSNITSPPAPTGAGDGVPIAQLSSSNRRASRYLVLLSPQAGAATVTAGGIVWGFTEGKWYRLGALNGGQDVVMGATTQGFADRLYFSGFERIAFSGTTSAAINVSIKAEEYTR